MDNNQLLHTDEVQFAPWNALENVVITDLHSNGSAARVDSLLRPLVCLRVWQRFVGYVTLFLFKIMSLTEEERPQ